MANKNYQITQLQDGGELLVLHPETNADIVVETSTKKVMTATERTKLQGVESGAQVFEVGKTGQTTPNPALAVGGLFYKEI